VAGAPEDAPPSSAPTSQLVENSSHDLPHRRPADERSYHRRFTGHQVSGTTSATHLQLLRRTATPGKPRPKTFAVLGPTSAKYLALHMPYNVSIPSETNWEAGVPRAPSSPTAASVPPTPRGNMKKAPSGTNQQPNSSVDLATAKKWLCLPHPTLSL